MEDWQRRAAEAAEAAFAARKRGEDEAAGALGGLPVVELDDEGCPVISTPTGFKAAPVGPRCGVMITRGRRKDQRCMQPAGQGTLHLGAGHCVAHGGAKKSGRAEAAWMVAHAFAGELACSPWEALLKAVRIAAQRVAYTDWVLAGATNDLELEGRIVRDNGVVMHPDTGEPLGVGQLRDLSWWVAQNTLWVDRLARYGKMAIDAGVAERLVQQVELEGQALGRVLSAALGELEGQGISEEALAAVRGAMRRELLAIEAEQQPQTVRATEDPDGPVVDSTYREG